MFLWRMVLGGLLVALIPEVARLLGPRAAGLVVLVPAVTVAGFIALAESQGTAAVATAAFAALPGLVAVAGFLLGVGVALRAGMGLTGALVSGACVWVVAAAAVVYILPLFVGD